MRGMRTWLQIGQRFRFRDRKLGGMGNIRDYTVKSMRLRRSLVTEVNGKLTFTGQWYDGDTCTLTVSSAQANLRFHG